MEDLDKANEIVKNSMIATLGIVFTEVSQGKMVATMPVDHRTHQPFGILHGGASCALAETLGSFGSQIIIEDSSHRAAGVEINCNHIRSVRDGLVTGTANIIHKGRKMHIWNVDIVNEEDKLVATSRITIMIIPIEKQ